MVEILIIFLFIFVIYVLTRHLIYLVGGDHTSLINLTSKDFSELDKTVYETFDVSPDYHLKKLTKSWVYKNNWSIIVLDSKFRYENPNLDKNEYFIPDAVITDGSKIIIIEFDEDSTFHSAKSGTYPKKWENYNYVLRKAYKNNMNICLLRVAYGPDKHSCGLKIDLQNISDNVNDFNDVLNVNSRSIMKNDFNGDLDKVFISTLNYINNDNDIRGKIILIYFDGNNQKICSGIIEAKDVDTTEQGTYYKQLLKWK